MVLGKEIKATLEAIVGSDDVTDEEFTITAYSGDISEAFPRKAEFIVIPESKEEVSEILCLATKDKIPVVVRGGGTLGWGVSLASEGIILDLTKMDKILRIDEATMTMAAQAGCPVYRVIKNLQQRGFDLPMRPWFGPGVTMGAWITSSASGGRMSRYGGGQSWVCGVEIVLPTGEIVQTGSAAFENCFAFMSNTSAANLFQIFLQSYGTFGVITEVTSAIISLPEATEHAAYGFSDAISWAKAAHMLQSKDAATSIDLEDNDLFNHFLEMEMPYPFIICLTNQGYKAEVECKMKVAAQICEREGGHPLSPTFAEVAWDYNATFSFRSAHFGRYTLGGSIHSCVDLPEVYRVTKEIWKKYNIPNGWFTWMGWPAWMVTFAIAYYNGESQREDAYRASLEIMKARMKLPNLWFAPLRPPYEELTKKIKDTLDPSGIMNPGTWDLVGGGLLKFVVSMGD